MRYLSIFTLLVASASLASANLITIACGPQVSSINGGIVTVGPLVATCAAQSFAGFTISAVSLGFAGAFSDGNPANSSIVTYNGTSSLGNFGPISTPADVLSANTGFISGLNPGASSGGLINVSVTTTSTGASTPDSAQFSVFATYTYETTVTQPGVPEPTTLALVGGVLLLAGIRKFRS